MNTSSKFAGIGCHALVATLLCALLVAIGYWFIDRPVALFVHRYRLEHELVFKWLTWPPPIVQAWTPAILVALVLRRAFGPFRRWERALLVACLGMIVADQFRESLGYVFGRYWPETWIDNNPSFITDGAYGFHPFHGGRAFGSFPSGHMARTLAVAAVVWIAYPHWRWASGLASLAVAAGLLALNYHFLSDLIAGGFVGGIVGIYAAQFAKLGELEEAASLPSFGKCPALKRDSVP